MLITPGEPTPGAENTGTRSFICDGSFISSFNSQNRSEDVKLLLVQLGALNDNGGDRFLA